MESTSEKAVYEKVADNIRNNVSAINKQLDNCEFESKIASKETEDKIMKFLSLNPADLMKDELKSDYYDLDEVAKIFEMLEPPKAEGKRRLKTTKSGSLISLTPGTSMSVEDISQQQDNVSEIANRLKEIRDLLGSISNSSIKSPDLDSIKDEQTSQNTFFVDLVMSLQKLARELQSIASSDATISESKPVIINGKFIEDLNRLSQTLSDIEQSNKNPIARLPRLESSTHFHLTSVINEILDAIEKNPL